MTFEEFEIFFTKYQNEYHKFEKIKFPICNRPDLCAFILLDKLLPNTKDKTTDMINSVEHDKLYLDIDCEKLAEIISENDIIYLIRCGIIYDEQYQCLEMIK